VRLHRTGIEASVALAARCALGSGGKETKDSRGTSKTKPNTNADAELERAPKALICDEERNERKSRLGSLVSSGLAFPPLA
jgi:hypothetical protein